MSAERDFCDLFHEVFMRFHRRRKNDEVELSAESAAILEHMDRAGPLTVTEAARHFQRSQSSVSEIVSRLERRGWIERFPDERDRRRHLVWMTPSGVDRLREARRILDENLVAVALRELGETNTETLVSTLRMLVSIRSNEGKEKTDD